MPDNDNFLGVDYVCPNCHHLNLPKRKSLRPSGLGDDDVALSLSPAGDRAAGSVVYDDDSEGRREDSRASSVSPPSSPHFLAADDTSSRGAAKDDPSPDQVTPKQSTKRAAVVRNRKASAETKTAGTRATQRTAVSHISSGRHHDD